MKNIPSPTGSGAIVMGIGIFINGAIVQFSFLNKELARPFALILFLLLVFIAASYIMDVVKKRMFKTHFANPIGSFAVGTWIAGTSVCGIALCQRMPEWKPLVQLLVIGNVWPVARLLYIAPLAITDSFSSLMPGRKCMAFCCSRRSVRNRWLLYGRPPSARALSIK